MQATRQAQGLGALASKSRAGALPQVISTEWLAWLGLALLALLLRAADLDSVPLSDHEARNALQAWHTVADSAPGSYQAADSPLAFISQLLTFSLLGASAFTARILPMLAGVALALTPLLFRDSLGRTRAFVWASLLSLLSIPVAASRLADGGSFLILFALLAVWMIRRYWYSGRVADARNAIGLVTAMTCLCSPAGIPLLVIMLAAGWLAVWRTALSAPQRLDLPGDDILQLATRRLRAFPLRETALVPAAVIILTATVFMLNPAGLRTVSQLIDSALAGFTQSHSADGTRVGFLALLAHEPLLIVFALGGAWLLWKQGAVTYIDRFAAAWALIGALALLLYPGASPADAMWVVLPLSLLASYGITQLMVDRRVVILWEAGENADDDRSENDDSELYSTAYWWVKWLIGGIVLGMLLLISVQFMHVARLLLELPAEAWLGEALSLLATQDYLRLLHALGMLLLPGIILLAVCLLLTNFWGSATCLQGIGLGFLGMMLLSSVGGGWGLAARDPDQPDGVWRQTAISAETPLLQETLFELSARQTGGFPLLDMTVVEDRERGISRDGLVAWLLRDYPQARFAPVAAQAKGQPIVLMADDEAQAAQLQGDYVGQRFVLRRSWSLADASLWDLPAWWTQSLRREGSQSRADALMLWLRQDVYDGATTALAASP